MLKKQTEKEAKSVPVTAPDAPKAEAEEKENTVPEQQETKPEEKGPAGEEERTPPEKELSETDKEEPEAQPDPEKGQESESAADEKEQAEKPTPKEPETSSETDNLKNDLLNARSQLAAYEAGVAPEMIADAVTLAMSEAKAAGEVTEEAVRKAMANVLKRHPEWKAAGTDKKKAGGFRLGADPDKAQSGRKTDTSAKTNTKRWNRFK